MENRFNYKNASSAAAARNHGGKFGLFLKWQLDQDEVLFQSVVRVEDTYLNCIGNHDAGNV